MERPQGSDYTFTITNTGYREPTHFAWVHGKQRLDQNHRPLQRRLTRLSPPSPALPSWPRREVHTRILCPFSQLLNLPFGGLTSHGEQWWFRFPSLRRHLPKPKLKQGQVEPSSPLLLDENLNYAHKEISTNRKWNPVVKGCYMSAFGPGSRSVKLLASQEEWVQLASGLSRHLPEGVETPLARTEEAGGTLKEGTAAGRYLLGRGRWRSGHTLLWSFILKSRRGQRKRSSAAKFLLRSPHPSLPLR